MTQPTPATQPALTDLLAGVIDLGACATPPHGPGPCTALCVPACAGKAATDRRRGRPTSARTDATPPNTTAVIGPR